MERTPINFTHMLRDVQPMVEEYGIPLCKVFYPDNPGEIAELFRKIMRDFNYNDPYREELLDGYTRELLIKLSRSIHREKTALHIGGKDREKLQQLRWEILSHPEHKWAVEDMAKIVSLSSSRLHAVYKELFGVSPMKDVVNGRIEQAKSLLLMDNNLTLQAISERLGYNNQYHFIRQFGELTGMTPGAYRKKHH